MIIDMIQDRYNMLKEQISQPQEGCNEPPTVDESQLWYEAIGGEKKHRDRRQ